MEMECVFVDLVLKCFVMEFGDEVIEIEVCFWFNDLENGVLNVFFVVMLNIWDKFKEVGIDILLCYEDILIILGLILKVEMVMLLNDDSD